MKSLTKNLNVLIAILIVAFGVFIYNTFVNTGDSSVTQSMPTAGNDLIEIYEDLQTVRLDPTLFSMPGYSLLVDFSTPVPPQTVGRQNPFEILGRN